MLKGSKTLYWQDIKGEQRISNKPLIREEPRYGLERAGCSKAHILHKYQISISYSRVEQTELGIFSHSLQ